MMRFRRAPRSGKLRELENLRVTGKKTPPGRAGTHTGQRARYLKIHTFTRTYRKGLLIDDSTDDALGVAVLKLLPRISRVYRQTPVGGIYPPLRQTGTATGSTGRAYKCVCVRDLVFPRVRLWVGDRL